MVQIKQGTNKLLYQITDPVQEQLVGLCALHKLDRLTITKCYTQNNNHSSGPDPVYSSSHCSARNK